MTKERKVKIILGGTFNPVHYGHLRIAEEMLNLFPKAEISLMPAAFPPHRSKPSASPEQRIAMLDLALTSSPQLQIDTREIEREEPSYSVVTLEQIRQEAKDSCLIFIMGTDAFAKLDSWYQWQKLLTLTNILVIKRPGSGLPRKGPVAKLMTEQRLDDISDLAKHQYGKISYYQMPLLDISSTYIRNQIKCGKSPRFLLPNDILDYIKQNHLYLN
ncbi:MAG: nicotinate-nucleotide adenylyltransferase [Gammaproteobacteria bacterium]|nr:nicotinate-nucleotide adenylyltransferase [Gammaproteobacteria bacterium]